MSKIFRYTVMQNTATSSIKRLLTEYGFAMSLAKKV